MVILGLLLSKRGFIVGLDVVNVSLEVSDLLSEVGFSLQLNHDLLKGSDFIDRDHSAFSFLLELFVLVVEGY